jgi:hypothetical protein
MNFRLLAHCAMLFVVLFQSFAPVSTALALEVIPALNEITAPTETPSAEVPAEFNRCRYRNPSGNRNCD